MRIPKALALDVDLEKGAKVEFSADERRPLIVSPAVASHTLADLLEDMRPSNLHGATDWGPPVGLEIW